mmetsp:Transcript_16579/g.23016  ORF Transcript_16579/g.23016 Transcript_16579/m.23016 type:complete len:746 (-) Transcript_16579:33-2270(-)
MQVRLRTLVGKNITIDLPPNATVKQLAQLTSPQVHGQHVQFVWQGRLLRTGILSDAGVKPGDCLVIIPSTANQDQEDDKMVVDTINEDKELREITIIPKISAQPKAIPSTPTTTTTASPLRSSGGLSKSGFLKELKKSQEKPVDNIPLKSSGKIPAPSISTPPKAESPEKAVEPAKSESAPSISGISINEITRELQGLLNTVMQNSSGSPRGQPPSSSSAPSVPSIDPVALLQLKDMGFADEAAKKALLLNKMNTQLAMDWLLEHSEDADINEPLSPQQLQQLSQREQSFAPDVNVVQRLADMGFAAQDIQQALRITNNNYEAAAAWLLGDREIPAQESDEEDLSVDDSNPIVKLILSNETVQNALSNPRIMQALRNLIENPSSAEQYISDPEIGPILLLCHNIIQENQSKEDEEEEEEEEEEKNESGKRVKKEDSTTTPQTKKQKTENETPQKQTAIKRTSTTPKKSTKKEKEEKVKTEKEAPKKEEATPKKRGPGRPKKVKEEDEFVPSDEDSKTTKTKKQKVEKEEKTTLKKEKVTPKKEKATPAKTPKEKVTKKEKANDNAAPEDLLTSYQQSSSEWGGPWISGFKFGVSNPKKALQTLLECTDKDKRLDQISLFAQAGRKSFFAFWNHEDMAEDTPVIFLGPEGEAWLVASSLSQFIAMQAAGLDGEMLRAWDGKDEEFESPEKYEEGYQNFLKWVKSKKIKPMAKSKVFKTIKEEKRNHPPLKSFLFPQGKHDDYESDE